MRFFTLCLMFCVSGCLRPVWTETPRTLHEPTSRNGVAPEPVGEIEDANSEDRYRVTFADAELRPWRVTFYVSSTEEYRLGCRWQGDNCLGLLPEEARESRLLVIGLPHRLCTRIRIFRDDEELGVIERFRWGCGFMLGEPP